MSAVELILAVIGGTCVAGAAGFAVLVAMFRLGERHETRLTRGDIRRLLEDQHAS